MDRFGRISTGIGGLLGAFGIAAAAAATHMDHGQLMGPASLVALSEAVLLLFLPVVTGAGVLRNLALLAAITGSLLFCGTLAMLALADARLFANSAPAGGILLMIGWILAGGAVAWRR